MALVTIDGHIGAGGSQLGRRVARMVDHEYVDRLVLPGVNLIEQPQTSGQSRSDRIWSFIEKAVRGIALGNAAGDPYFAQAELSAFPLTWDSSPGAPMAKTAEDVAHSLQSLLATGRSILVQRAGAVMLKSHEQVLKIGVFASWEDRVARTMNSQGFTRASDAERVIREREAAQAAQAAQAAYFERSHGAHPEDRSLYDICIDTSLEQITLAAIRISRLVRTDSPVTA
ncbi:MAG: cytidylate kinase family protein [Chloroflexi bacterium]|nr:cytidylate kinase family protein [Chloroflexota bacterium]